MKKSQVLHPLGPRPANFVVGAGGASLRVYFLHV